ncbi:hypothetical protein [Streptomyces sp. NPDC001642]|uniref:hypothetical protein n=1 Tax=Streptomyces sp. NPDC001642 TaxID=3154392 RepID=UPI0033345883
MTGTSCRDGSIEIGAPPRSGHPQGTVPGRQDLALVDTPAAPMVQRDANHRLVDEAMAAGPEHSHGVSVLVELPQHNTTAEAERPSRQETRPAGSR